MHVFGPVPSRRLGFSLGIDIVPYKVCSYDCIYCQLGRTTEKTIKRTDYVSVSDVSMELERKLQENVKIDYITLSGSGEPTLCASLGALIDKIKSLTDIPLAVLTNGSLLWDDEVRRELAPADLVIPSLDAGTADVFAAVNQPCRDLTFDQVVQGILEFSDLYKEKIWMEVLLLDGISSDRDEALAINRILQKVDPARIQLNTVKRPPADSAARAVPAGKMLELSGCFDGNVEIISDFSRSVDGNYLEANKENILDLLKRRPCSLTDIADGLNLHQNEIVKYLEEMLKSGEITTHEQDHILYYSA